MSLKQSEKSLNTTSYRSQKSDPIFFSQNAHWQTRSLRRGLQNCISSAPYDGWNVTVSVTLFNVNLQFLVSFVKLKKTWYTLNLGHSLIRERRKKKQKLNSSSTHVHEKLNTGKKNFRTWYFLHFQIVWKNNLKYYTYIVHM